MDSGDNHIGCGSICAQSCSVMLRKAATIAIKVYSIIVQKIAIYLEKVKFSVSNLCIK